jgi:plasmid replication initiation protein
MLKSKSKRRDLVLVDKNRRKEVKKSERLVTAKFEFSALALKILNFLITSIKDTDTPDTIYRFSIKEFAELYDKENSTIIYKRAKEAIVEIMEKVIQIEDEKTWQAYHILRNPVIIKGRGVVEVKFDEGIFPILLETKKRYLSYNIENILPLNSKYSIRLYELLKNDFGEKTRYNQAKEAVLTYDLKFLREILIIPKTYRYVDIRKKVIEQAQKELNKHTDISFEFRALKEGRKVTKIEFIVTAKEKRENKDDFNSFRQNLLKKARQNQNFLYIYLDNQEYELKQGYLFKDGKLLSSETAFEEWRELFNNQDKLVFKTLEEKIKDEEKKAKELKSVYEEIEELKRKYKYLLIKFDGKNREAVLSDIQFKNKTFKVFLTIENTTLIHNFKTFDKVEEFLKKCNEAYKNNK